MSPASAQDNILGFIAALRSAGLPISVSRAGLMFEAAALLPMAGLQTIFLAGRSTLCATPEDIARYDACFARFFFGDEKASADPAGSVGAAHASRCHRYPQARPAG